MLPMLESSYLGRGAEARMKQISRAAVLGAGTMGAAIAAHLANAGLRVTLLDAIPEEL